MFGGFSASKLKPQLKMAVSRIQIASNKKAALVKQSMRQVALMLAEDPPKEEKAKIRAEALIRDDHLMEAYEILQLECELLHERVKLLDSTKECPSDLVSVVSTIIWASHRVDIPELTLIRKQFRAKYGKKFEETALANPGGVLLNERVVAKLSVEPPAAYLVQTYLERICEQFEVDWKPKVRLTAAEMCEPATAPIGYSVGVAQGTGLGPVHAYTVDDDKVSLASSGVEDGLLPVMTTATPVLPPVAIPPPAPTTQKAKPKDDFAEPEIFVPGPGAPTNGKDDDAGGDVPPAAPSSGGGGASSSYEALAARFEQLKK